MMIYKNSVKDIGIGIMDMKPARKKPCLVVQKGNQIIKVASFNNEEAAVWFNEVFSEFLEIPSDKKAEVSG